ncbi:5-bromo-4-chloroindolyl phosphate hydrolase [Methylomonas lenta]|uniref:5-bromo-4-chloroindolyl phosphate hydrolase n=1 Tax=Methylomonas lenta TaxID=980561 RepID=A0A177NB88_9GAMM|nr:5-bromo-4-chloroindolyl phosphate hydrolysis family protein [Methylomonas lenta]OAI14360.1 5-bromo-4-chloroindolyl phosphate hydrolase [Methylomonas lenta]
MSKLPTLKSAKRFTGDTLRQYSPRGLLLYVLSLALIPAVVIGLSKGQVMTVIVNASAFTLYCLAAIWLRKGLQAENPSSQDRLQSPSKWPLKLFSAVLVAFTTGMLAVLAAQQSLVMAAIYACGAFLGMYFSYGFDQAKSRQIAGAHGYSGDEVRKTLADAFAIIKQIEQANHKIGNRELNQRIDGICQIADGIIAELEADSRGIRRARKFLHVYLENVQQVVQGYANTHQQSSSQALEQNFRQALETIESAFQEQQQKLLEEDLFDLDVKIEVLTAQLKREGIL